MNILKKMLLAGFVSSCLLLLNFPLHAAMVTTAQINPLQAASSQSAATIGQQRNWIQSQLEVHGVTTADAVLRVANLTDSQVLNIHQRMDEMPAGAGAGGLILTVFLVLLITDIVGYTDIFPFVRPIN